MAPRIAKATIHEIGFAQLSVEPNPHAFGTRKLESSLL